MSVNYISAVNSLLDLCPHYERALTVLHAKKPFNYEDWATLNTYLSFAQTGCYKEMHILSERVRQIQDGGPLIDLAQKMHQAAAPLTLLCKEGLELIEEQKANRAVGPELKHWLIIHLNELNLAILQLQVADRSNPAAIEKSVGEIKEAIRKICHFQGVIEKRSPEQVDEPVRQLNQICEYRLNQVDAKRKIRDEVTKNAWESALKEMLPQALSILGGIAAYVVADKLFELFISQLGDGIGAALAQSVMLAMTSIQLADSIRSKSIVFSCMNAIRLSTRTWGLYQRA